MNKPWLDSYFSGVTYTIDDVTVGQAVKVFVVKSDSSLTEKNER